MEKCQISDYVGSFLYLGAAMDKLAEAEPTKLPDPSCAQIRAAVTEYCVLPLGSQARYAEIASRSRGDRAEIFSPPLTHRLHSQAVKDHAPLNTYLKNGNPASKAGTPVLLIGSPGSGKKTLVNAVAAECGANIFNLTPSNTEGISKYSGKKVADMVHTVLKVAKALPPSVVWIDDVETVT